MTWEKIEKRLWMEAVRFARPKFFYHLLYLSWWHSLFFKPKVSDQAHSYLAAVPNPGAGIGHQLANWIAGLWFSRQFGLRHAHIPFSSSEWESLLGFGEGQVTLGQLVKSQGFRKVLLPLFDEFNLVEVEQIRKIIASYGSEKVVYVLEQDQFYRDQFGVVEDIQTRFYQASARKLDQLRYSSENFNIAIHVRRGDITVGQVNKNFNLLMRWQDAQYFKNVLGAVLESLNTNKKIKVYLFSQGARDEFTEFEKISDVEYCLEAGARESFLHMVFADLLIISKSSFSYKPALLSKGIKVCPRNFWHGYPNDCKWIIANEDGSLDQGAMDKLSAVQ